uniref:C2H2-type domain-containing protein n=1 Tax=Anopheles funestus TaxID=62324 RepID=A0A182RFT1_ANOFN
MSTVLSATGPKKCIICLQHAPTMVPLSTEVDIDGVAINCETMYGKFTGIQYDTAALAKERLLNLCLACLTQLNSSYLFQKLAIQSAESIFASLTKLQEQPAVGADYLEGQYFNASNEQSIDNTEISKYLEEENVEQKSLDHNSTLFCPYDEYVPSPNEIETEIEATDECTADEELLSIEPDTAEDEEQRTEQTVPEAIKPSCDECAQLKSNVMLFRKHFMQTHCLAKATDRYQCTVCLGKFKSTRSFIRHIRTHQGAKRYACQFCPKSFHYSHHLQAHERTHTNEKPFVCGKCNKAFASKERLSAHAVTHGEGREFACEVCRAMFKTRQNLHKHCLIKHDRPVAKFRSFKCDQCDKLMLSQSAVTYHKQHPCITNRQTKPHRHRTEQILQDTNHLQISINRKFHCDVCAAQFSQKIELKRHKLISLTVCILFVTDTKELDRTGAKCAIVLSARKEHSRRICVHTPMKNLTNVRIVRYVSGLLLHADHTSYDNTLTMAYIGLSNNKTTLSQIQSSDTGHK